MPSTWSSKGPTWEPSSTSLVVSAAATIWPVSASMPMCSFRQDRRVLVPCFSSSHSPAPHGFRPVLSTSRWTASPSRVPGPRHLQRLGPAAKGGVVGHRQSQPEQVQRGADQPFRLAQGQAEHGPQGQRRQDRQWGVPGLPARGGARRCAPAFDGCVGEPHRQAAALAQAGVVLAPVLNLMGLLGDVVVAILVNLEWQDEHTGIRRRPGLLRRLGLQRHWPGPCNNVRG